MQEEFSDKKKKKKITPYSLSQNQVLSSSTKQQKIVLAYCISSLLQHTMQNFSQCACALTLL